MNRSTPGLPVHHQLPEFTQTHVHWVGDAIQQSHPLSSPSPPDLNLSQHQGLFKWVSSSHQVAKVKTYFQLNSPALSLDILLLCHASATPTQSTLPEWVKCLHVSLLLLILFPIPNAFLCVKLVSCVWLFATPWTVACQALLSLKFPRQEYWSGLPFHSPGDLPKPKSPALQADSFQSESPGKPIPVLVKPVRETQIQYHFPCEVFSSPIYNQNWSLCCKSSAHTSVRAVILSFLCEKKKHIYLQV